MNFNYSPLIAYVTSDYINPIDLCNRLNTYIVPEAAVHAFLTALFLINGYWIALILNLPLLAYNAKKYGLHSTEERRLLNYAAGSLITSISSMQLKFSGNSMFTRRQVRFYRLKIREYIDILLGSVC